MNYNISYKNRINSSDVLRQLEVVIETCVKQLNATLSPDEELSMLEVVVDKSKNGEILLSYTVDRMDSMLFLIIKGLNLMEMTKLLCDKLCLFLIASEQ